MTMPINSGPKLDVSASQGELLFLAKEA